MDTRVVEEVRAFSETLAAAAARAPGPAAGFFGPQSALWMVVSEPVVAMGGVRAVLLQIAHPLIAAAGRSSSSFQADFLGRARRTFAAMHEIMFGDLASASRAARMVHALHTQVRGRCDPASSASRAGRPYAANDPSLLLWVLATLVDSSINAHSAFLRPLAPAACEAYYQDMRLLGALLGLPLSASPADYPAFRAYFDGMLAREELEVGQTARDLMAFLYSEGWSVGSWDEVLTAGLLPPRWREAFGFAWTAREKARFRALRASIRLIMRALPPAARRVPAWHQARLRLDRAAGRRGHLSDRLVNRLDARIDLPLSIRPLKAPPPEVMALYEANER